MAQQFDYPKTETELRKLQDKLYQHSKKVYDEGGRPALKGLLEIMSAEATIITAIHNIKSNHGSETPGVDSKTMRDYLQHSHSWVIRDIQSAFKHFEPQKIRRVYIDKPGKAEKRPLGIPTIRDRIVQECMRIVLEPIFEAQFFAHSYGFRPMRDAPMALERAKLLVHHTGYHWIVEGDISKCFDRIDHAILLKRLYHMGIRDRRVLQIIKAMVFCDLSTPKGNGEFNVYDDLRDKLIAKGIPPEQIAYVHSANTEVQKKELFGKVRSGQVRVLIGSTQKMGAGTNVQHKLISLHHLDCPWRPSDLQQREGRIIRQKNENDEVDIYTYVTENTFDSYLYQLVEGKQQQQLKKDIEELQRQCDQEDNRAFCKDQFLKAVRKFMEMKTLTPTILHELVERIDVYQTQGTGKNRTQRIVIHYNFIGILDMPEVEEYPDNVVLDSRQGVAVEYLVGKAG